METRGLSRLWLGVALLSCGLLIARAAAPFHPQEGERAGRFLVAAERMADPRFAKSVILLAGHGGEGSMGLVLNRPSEMLVEELFEESEGLHFDGRRLYFGGPVNSQRISFLFRAAKTPEHSVRLFEDVHLGEDRALLISLLEEPAEHSELRVFFGHAGWARGQLDGELARGDWHRVRAERAALFRKDMKGLWSELMAKLSGRWI